MSPGEKRLGNHWRVLIMRSCSEVLEDGAELVWIELAGAGIERQLVGDVRDAAQGLRAEPRRAEAGEVVGHPWSRISSMTKRRCRSSMPGHRLPESSDVLMRDSVLGDPGGELLQ